MMDNDQQRNLDRALQRLGRLPLCLQCALGPLLASVWVVSRFSILLPALCAVAAGILAFLKQTYLHDQLPWGKVALMATFPLWMFTAYGYAVIIWAAVGTIPLAIVVYLRQWRGGQPLTLWDPQPDITWESRAGLTARLREGKGVTQDDIRLILAIQEAQARRLRIPFRVVLCSFGVGFAGMGMARGLFGDSAANFNSLVLLLCFTTLAPIVYLQDSLDSRWLRCRQCRRTLSGDDLKRLLESNACPTCSTPFPLAARAKAKSAASRWDPEILG